jgi:hypothetical protein
VKVTTGLRVLPRLRMRGVMPSPTRYRLHIPPVTSDPGNQRLDKWSDAVVAFCNFANGSIKERGNIETSV